MASGCVGAWVCFYQLREKISESGDLEKKANRWCYLAATSLLLATTAATWGLDYLLGACCNFTLLLATLADLSSGFLGLWESGEVLVTICGGAILCGSTGCIGFSSN